MILQRRQRDDRPAVGDRHDAHFHAIEFFLDEDALGGGGKLGIAAERRDRLERDGAVAADKHTLAGRQAIGLHDHRHVLAGLEKFTGGRHGTKFLEHGRRHVAAVEDLLAEDLAALELGRPGGGTEDSQPGGGEGIDDARHQRRFGPDDGEVDAAILGQFQKPGNIGGGDGHIFGNGRRARVSGGDQHFGAVANQFPGQGVFAAAAANDQNSAGCGQGLIPSRMAAGRRRRRIVAARLPTGQGGAMFWGNSRRSDVDTSAVVDTVKRSS